MKVGFEYPYLSNKVGEIPHRENYFFEKIDGKILIGGGAQSQFNLNKNIYWFNPQTKKLDQLTELPEGLVGFKIVYKVGNSLIFEQGLRYEEFRLVPSRERWKLDLNSKNWERLSDSKLESNAIYKHFIFSDQLYSLIADFQNGIYTLAKKNFSTFEWEIIKDRVDLRSSFYVHQPVQINGFSYFIQEDKIERLDLSSGEVDLYPVNTGQRFNSSSAFNLKDKAYLGVDFSLYEFDPAYLSN